MARRRVISAELLVDEEFNSLSMEVQLLFLRILCVTDDYGIVAALCSLEPLREAARECLRLCRGDH